MERHRSVSGGVRPDLIDANETTWAFVAVCFVEFVRSQQVKQLAKLASWNGCRRYCGRTADCDPSLRFRPERERALAVRGVGHVTSGDPPPHCAVLSPVSLASAANPSSVPCQCARTAGRPARRTTVRRIAVTMIASSA